jgi:hypothetical protein
MSLSALDRFEQYRSLLRGRSTPQTRRQAAPQSVESARVVSDDDRFGLRV